MRATSFLRLAPLSRLWRGAGGEEATAGVSHTPGVVSDTERCLCQVGAPHRGRSGTRRSGALPALMRDLRLSAPPREAADRTTEGAFSVHYGAATVGTSHTVG